MASFGVGKNVGIARNAELVLVRLELTWARQLTYREKLIEAMLLIADDVATKPENSAVINMSFGKRVAADGPDSPLYYLLRTWETHLPISFVI